MPIYRIFGIGMGRTGTKSLATAMKILGYSSKHGGGIQDVKQYEFLNDIGIAIRYKFLDYYYGPTAKFILTYQDIESWIEMAKYVARAKGGGTRNREGVIKGTVPHRAENRFMMYGICHFDEKIMRETHERHNREIIEHFKGRDNLLMMNIVAGDGWNKLCPFVGKPIPEIPFPHKHKTGAW